MDTKLLCIYHASCMDGFAAAWVVRKAIGENKVEFHAASYGDEPPDVTGRDVLIVDFSYPRDTLQEMGSAAATLLVLDHHKSAAEALKDIPKITSRDEWERDRRSITVAALFDMNRSGAGITWDFFFPGKLRPMLLDIIEDRDLWRFSFLFTREICAALSSYPYDFRVWDELMRMPINMTAEGVVILRKQKLDIEAAIAATHRTIVIGGYTVPVANLPYVWASEAGHILCGAEPFAATYVDTPKGRQFSLRSTDNGLDVSEIAKCYGGGGHRNAAGFTAPLGWEGENGLVPFSKSAIVS